tara:strand:+ start:147 stop:944 length:798 start_codon:yes stop_codon:yes gene_type:complete
MLATLLCSTAALAPSSSSSHVRPLPRSLRQPLRVRGGAGAAMSAGVVERVVCPALGFVLSSALYYSPVPALRSCLEKQSLGQFNPIPSATMVIGTTAWLGYGLSVKDPWIAATNLPGTLVAIAQMVVMLPLMKPGRQLSQVQAIILGGATATTALWARLIFGGVSAAARSRALGIYATIICIALFASPLTTIASVVRNRNAASILAPLTASQVANCVLWTTYGVFAAKDPFVWGPNGVGLVLGLVQLACKLAFPSVDEEGAAASS